DLYPQVQNVELRATAGPFEHRWVHTALHCRQMGALVADLIAGKNPQQAITAHKLGVLTQRQDSGTPPRWWAACGPTPPGCAKASHRATVCERSRFPAGPPVLDGRADDRGHGSKCVVPSLTPMPSERARRTRGL